MLIEGMSPDNPADDPYHYILYAEFWADAKAIIHDMVDINAQASFKMTRNSINNAFYFEIISLHSTWLDAPIQ